MAEGISLAEQGSIAKEFLEGLLASMNIQAEITVKELTRRRSSSRSTRARPRSSASSSGLAEPRSKHCKK